MLQILLAIVWLLVVPFDCGLWIVSRMPKKHHNFGTIFLTGYLVMIAFFQCFYVGFFMAGSVSFTLLRWVFGIFIVLFSIVSAGSGRTALKTAIEEIKNKEAIGYKIVFALFLLAQVVMRLCQQVSDGDDAYYIATAAGAYASGNMNMVAPYTGYVVTYIDYRHAFSGAPFWLAFLSRMTFIPPAAMAHSVLAPVLIVLHYIIVLNVGELLFKDKKTEKYLFAIIVSLFNVYGYVSIYTAQTFLLTRTWQGKSMFANLYLPAAILLLLWIAEGQKKKKTEIVYFIFAIPVLFGGTAMTTMGVVLLPLVFGVGILMLTIVRKEPGLLWKGIVTCIPSILVGLAYILV